MKLISKYSHSKHTNDYPHNHFIIIIERGEIVLSNSIILLLQILKTTNKK